jgi:hypothetical protein
VGHVLKPRTTGVMGGLGVDRQDRQQHCKHSRSCNSTTDQSAHTLGHRVNNIAL